jgi:hypothetical protein
MSEKVLREKKSEAKQGDNVGLIVLAVLAACGVSAYGFRAGEAVWQWIVPAGLVLAAGAFAAWRSLRARTAARTP